MHDFWSRSYIRTSFSRNRLTTWTFLSHAEINVVNLSGISIVWFSAAELVSGPPCTSRQCKTRSSLEPHQTCYAAHGLCLRKGQNGHWNTKKIRQEPKHTVGNVAAMEDYCICSMCRMRPIGKNQNPNTERTRKWAVASLQLPDLPCWPEATTCMGSLTKLSSQLRP